MKKKLLTSCIILGVSSIVNANERVKNFYIEPSIGASFFRDAKEKDEDLSIKYLKQNAKTAPHFKVALGYYINDFLRTDLTLGYHNVSFRNKLHHYKAGEFVDNEGNDYFQYKPSATIIRTTEILYSMLNGYFDIPLNDKFGCFLGGGVGIARVAQELDIKLRASDQVVGKINADSKAINFAYQMTVGASYKVTEIARVGVSYSWMDFGKSKAVRYGDEDDKTSKIPYKCHSVNVGVRFDI